jgi:N-acetyl sugar amidotransferase
MICQRCIFNDTVPNIVFDQSGVCSYCHQTDMMEAEYPNDARGEKLLTDLVARIKESGKRKEYDAVIGVSGGCDSSYLLHTMAERGVRLVAAHFDNTWNSTIATENINSVLGKLEIPLFTKVVDNKEYDDIYRSFFLSGVKDVEAPTDIGLAATIYHAAKKFDVKYMIEGHSFRTEGIAPLGWIYMDGRYVRSVHKIFGSLPMESFPNMELSQQLRWMIFGRYKKVRPLYYMNYDKEKAKELLAAEYGWKWYGGHHLENRFTAFFHSYFLPTRWGIDFRIAGYSAYCRSGAMAREEALDLMSQPPHMEDGLLDYVKTRLGYSDSEFDVLMNLPKKAFTDYPTNKRRFEQLRPFFWIMYRMDLIPKSFYIKYTRP